MSTTVWNNVSKVYERFNDDTRTVDTLDEAGAVISTRPYTADENATADATAAQPAIDAEHAATKDRIKTIIEDLKVEKDRVQPTIDATNATINANPAGYIKNNARAAKRIADAAIDLAKYVDGR